MGCLFLLFDFRDNFLDWGCFTTLHWQFSNVRVGIFYDFALAISKISAKMFCVPWVNVVAVLLLMAVTIVC